MINPTQLRLLAHLAPFAILLHAASPAASQQPADEEAITVTGTVVAEGGSAGVAGAAVLLSDRAGAVIADRDGRFTLRDVRPGSYSVVVTQLGYDTLWTEMEIEREQEPLMLQLTADPIVLERVTAIVDRLASRRNAVGTSVRVFDQVSLRTSTARTVLEHVASRTIFRMTRCPNFMAMSPCAVVRGRPTEVQVYIDGARVVGGLNVLAAYRPDELYTVEVIGGGRAVRVYTNWFMETIAEGRRMPDVYLF